MDVRDAALVSTVVTQGVFVYGVFAPNVFMVRQASPSPADAEDVRHGVLVASAITIGLGVMTASIVESNAPVVAALGTAGLMWWVYTNALRTRGKGERE